MKKKFSLLLIINLILFENLFAQQGWQWKNQSSGVSIFLRDVCFVDSLYGWAVGDSGIAITTTNGGENWTRIISLPNTVELKQVQFINRKIGFVGGNIIKKYPYYESRQALLLCTTNGGLSWERCDSSIDTNFSFGCLTFFNSDTGCVSINNNGQKSWNDRKGVILKTTNGGFSWSILREENLILSEALVWTDNRQAYSFWSPSVTNSDNTYVYVSIDGGETWNWVGTIEAELVKNAKFIKENNLWAIGFKTSLSQNGGQNWQSWNWFISTDGQKRFIPTDIEVIDSNNVLLVGDAMTSANDIEGRLLKTSDTGKNWYMDLQLQNCSFSALTVIDKKNAWIVGSNGLILHSNNIITEVNTKEERFPNNFVLKQNFPNPFNPSTKIEFNLAYATNVTLEIFDVLGRKIKTLINSYLERGLHIIVWDGTNGDGSLMPSSLYIYCITAGTVHENKKMMLIH